MRLINKSDIPFIITCLQALRSESPICKESKNDPGYVADRLTMQFSCNDFNGVIEPEVGFVLGCVVPGIWYCEKVRAYEQLWYVKPEHRGSTTAIRLMHRFIEVCKLQGATEVIAGSSIGLREKDVLRVYNKLGFKHHSTGVRLRLDK